jgi:hypothetical protein
LTEKSGRLVDGSAFAEKTLATYRNESLEMRVVRADKQDALIITLDEFPYLSIRAGVPDGATSNISVPFVSRTFLGGSFSGWNEFTQELAGSATLRWTGNLAYLNLETALEAGAIVNGKIQHNGTKYAGSEALASLQHREERINALVAWLRSQDGAPDFADEETFAAYWKALMLPEVVSAKKRPPAYTALIKDSASAQWTSGVKWNQTYTKSLLPEELWPLRDSGSLLRDWEDAHCWIYFEYQWERIEKSLREINLIKER